MTTTYSPPPGAYLVDVPVRRETSCSECLNSDAILQVIKHIAWAAIPVYNVFMLICAVSAARTYKSMVSSAHDEGDEKKANDYKGRCEASVIATVATFMVAVGSALLLAGLYYYMASDYTLSNDLFMAGGGAAGLGVLLFSITSYWSYKTDKLYG